MRPTRPPAWRRTLAATLAATLTLSTLALPAAAQVRLPSLGESASDDLSVGAERRLGDQIMREARRDPEYLDDPVLLEYLRGVWTPLVAAARRLGDIDASIDQAFAWEPFLVRDRSVNAFALPGGYVGLHLGMIAVATTRDQMASVLAHELSHVTQRHIARSIAPQQQASLVSIAALLLGIIVASRANNADIANAAIMGGQGAAIQQQLNFSRGVEREADRIGYAVLVAAGYAPSAMAAMFEKLDTANRLNDNSSYPYLRSHPLTVDRISEARSRTLLGNNAPAVPTIEHALMQARARVLMDDGAQTLQRISGRSSSPLLPDRISALYAGAFAASKLGEHARAQRQLTEAMQLAEAASPREPQAERVLQLLQVEVLLAQGDATGALQALDRLPPLPPLATAAAADPAAGLSAAPPPVDTRGRPAMLLRAQAALALNTRDAAAAAAPLRETTQALQTWVAEQPQDAAAWDLLASSAGALGLKLRAMRAGAEARAVVGDLGGAIDRLRAAQAATRSASGQDFIEASVIDSRMRQLVAQRRQLALEARGEKSGRDEPAPQWAPR